MKKLICVIFISVLILGGCSNKDQEAKTNNETNSNSETISIMKSDNDSESIPGTTSESDANSKDIIAPDENYFWFMYDDMESEMDIYHNYDYAGYIKSFYISVSEPDRNIIYVNPVSFKWTQWGPEETWVRYENGEPVGWLFEIENDSEEVLSLQVADNAEFHIFNTMDDFILRDLSDVYYERECITSDLSVFIYYIQKYHTGRGYPFFISLNENNEIQYITEYPFNW